MQTVWAKNASDVAVHGGVVPIAVTDTLNVSLGDLVVVHGSYVGQSGTGTGNVNAYLDYVGGTGALSARNGLNSFACTAPSAPPGSSTACTPSGVYECVKAGTVILRLSGYCATGTSTVAAGDGFVRAFVLTA